MAASQPCTASSSHTWRRALAREHVGGRQIVPSRSRNKGTAFGSGWPRLSRWSSCSSVMETWYGLRIDVTLDSELLHDGRKGERMRCCPSHLDLRWNGSETWDCFFRRFSSAFVIDSLPVGCDEGTECRRIFHGTSSVVVSRGAGCRCKVTAHSRSYCRRSRPTADKVQTLGARSGPGGPREDDGAP